MSVRTADDADRQQAGNELAASARRRLLQERIRSGGRAAERSLTAVPRRTDPGPVPLSVSQRQLWYLSQLAPDATAYNELATLRKAGPIDLSALRAAFNEFVRRHEAWRTTFELVDGEPCQVVHEPRPYPLPLLDLSGFPIKEAEQRAAEIAVEDTRRPYDLRTGPLVRARLVRVAPDDHRLHLSMQHIVFDGVTLYRILLPEIVALYDAYSSGLPSPLPEPAVQYPDYAAWEVAWAAGPEVEARIEYWRKHLAGAPALDLPTDHRRPAIRRFRGGTISTPVDAATADRLRAAARRTGATLFQFLTALYAWWLGRCGGHDEVVFATVTDLRRRPDLVGMAGYCLAPVVVRADLSGDPTVEELVGRVRADLLDGLDNVVPFQWLVQQLGTAREPGRNPIFQVSFELEPPPISPDPTWALHQMDDPTSEAVGQAKFDLTIELDERPDGHLDGRLVYDADLFTADSARRMARHWTRLLEAVGTASPGSSLAGLDRVAVSTGETSWPAQEPSPSPIFRAPVTGSHIASPPSPGSSTLNSSTAGSIGAAVEAIWCDLLATDAVDRATSFFDLGGHSLLAVTMLVRLEEQLNVRISLRDALLVGPTVEKLVDLIDGGSSPMSDPNAANQAFFLFPDAASFMALRHFRRALEPATRVVGWPLRDSERDWTESDSVEAAADEARRMIQEIQPHGPYRMAGYSLTGLVAYEVARQLLEAGKTVDWVCVLDTPVPSFYHTKAARLGRGWSRGPRSFLARSAHLAAHRVATMVGPSRKHPATEPPAGAGPTLASRFALTPHTAPLVVIASRESADACRSATLGWASAHRAPVALVSVPGDHGSMFEPPGRDVMVEGLQRILQPHGGRGQAGVSATLRRPADGQATDEAADEAGAQASTGTRSP